MTVTLGVDDGEEVLDTDSVAPADGVRPADGERPAEAEAKRSVGEMNEVRVCVVETVTVGADETDADTVLFGVADVDVVTEVVPPPSRTSE